MIKKIFLTILLISSLFSLSGCGWFSAGPTDPVNLHQPMRTVAQNMKAIELMSVTVKKYTKDYEPEELEVLLQAQGCLKSLLEYATRLSSLGEANKGNVTTLWNMAQIEYSKIRGILDTSYWNPYEQALFESLVNDAARLSNEIDYALSVADDNASRHTMDLILGQLNNVLNLWTFK